MCCVSFSWFMTEQSASAYSIPWADSVSFHFFSLLTIAVNVFYPVESLRFSSEEFHLDGMVYVLETDMKNKVIFIELMPKWKWTFIP